jgi:conjugal transfer pilus assembly protein TraW
MTRSSKRRWKGYMTAGVVFLSIACFQSPGHCRIKDLGQMGRTYPIAEQDALTEIQNKAAHTDWSKVINPETRRQKIENYRPKKQVFLPRAVKNRKYLVNMTYTLPFDIPDGKGGILYPKGYTFNPLDYVQYPNILVIINAADPDQTAWFASSRYAGDYRTKLLITEGSYYDTANRLKRPVFYVMPKIAKRLHLVAVPSVARQVGNQMEVREIEIKPKNNR